MTDEPPMPIPLYYIRCQSCGVRGVHYSSGQRELHAVISDCEHDFEYIGEYQGYETNTLIMGCFPVHEFPASDCGNGKHRIVFGGSITLTPESTVTCVDCGWKGNIMESMPLRKR